jgi:ATP-binding cassette subfamily F protein 3
MIQLSSLSKSFGDRVLLDAVSWQIDDRERVGLAGPNGAGKTTLLKILAGLDEPDSGSVVKPAALAVGYLPQDGLIHSGRTLVEEAGLAFKPLLDMRDEISSLEERLADDSAAESEHAAMLTRYSELQENFRRLEGYSIDLKITCCAAWDSLRTTSTNRARRFRAAGRCASRWRSCSSPPGLLCWTSPNASTSGAQLAGGVSRTTRTRSSSYRTTAFSSTRSSRITEIGRGSSPLPSLQRYLVERDAHGTAAPAKRDQDDEIERMQAFINRFRYQATKALGQSRIKMMDKIVHQIPPAEAGPLHVPARAGGQCRLRDVHNQRSRRVRSHQRASSGATGSLIGPNGAGKSTLMRMLSGVEPPTAARGRRAIKSSRSAKQDEATRLDPC